MKTWIFLLVAALICAGVIGFSAWHDGMVREKDRQEAVRLEQDAKAAAAKVDEDLARIKRDTEDRHRISQHVIQMLKSDAYTSAEAHAWEEKELQKLEERQRHEEVLDAIHATTMNQK